MNSVRSSSRHVCALIFAIASYEHANAQSMAPVSLWCPPTVRDQALPINCLSASSTPTLGMLYPQSFDFNVDPYGSLATGRIGPYRIGGDLEDRILCIDVGASSIFGGDPVIELARFSSTSGVGNGNIEFINSHNTTNQMIALIAAGTEGNSTDKGGLLQFFTKAENSGSGVVSRMIILDDGLVGIGTQNPTERLHVNGNILASGTITPSDARFKQNVVEVERALDLVRALRGVRFDWKRDEFPERGLNDRRQLGFIAQEVNAVLPEVVSQGRDGYLAVDYSKLTPVLVEAVQELALQTDGQAQEIDALRSRVAELEQVRAEVETLKASFAALATK